MRCRNSTGNSVGQFDTRFCWGLIAAAIAQRSASVVKTTLWSGLVGLLLSILATIPSDSYAEIIIPGTIVGLLTGFITIKWGK